MMMTWITVEAEERRRQLMDIYLMQSWQVYLMDSI